MKQKKKESILPEFLVFANWEDVKHDFSDHGLCLLYKHLRKIEEVSGDTFSDILERPLNVMFKCFDTDRNSARHCTGVEQVWRASGLNSEFLKYPYKFIELAEDLCGVSEYVPIEYSIQKAKAELMTKLGIILCYDSQYNCLVAMSEYEPGQ